MKTNTIITPAFQYRPAVLCFACPGKANDTLSHLYNHAAKSFASPENHFAGETVVHDIIARIHRPLVFATYMFFNKFRVFAYTTSVYFNRFCKPVNPSGVFFNRFYLFVNATHIYFKRFKMFANPTSVYFKRFYESANATQVYFNKICLFVNTTRVYFYRLYSSANPTRVHFIRFYLSANPTRIYGRASPGFVNAIPVYFISATTIYRAGHITERQKCIIGKQISIQNPLSFLFAGGNHTFVGNTIDSEMEPGVSTIAQQPMPGDTATKSIT